MAKYVDSFVIPVPKNKLKAYTAMAKKSAAAWIKHGALEYVETVADDVAKGKVTSFPRSVKLKSSEIAVLGYAVYKSRAHRDSVLAKLMNDPAMIKLWDEMPIDTQRMFMGGFKAIASSKR